MPYECYFNYKNIDNLNEKIIECIAANGLHAEFPPNYEHLQLDDKRERQLLVRICTDSPMFTDFIGEENTLFPFDVLLTLSLKLGKNDGKVNTGTIPIIEKDDTKLYLDFDETGERINDPYGRIKEYSHRLEMSQEFMNNLGAVFPLVYIGSIAEVCDGLLVIDDGDVENDDEEPRRVVDKKDMKNYVSISEYLLDARGIEMELEGRIKGRSFVKFNGWNNVNPKGISDKNCNCLNWLKKLFK